MDVESGAVMEELVIQLSGNLLLRHPNGLMFERGFEHAIARKKTCGYWPWSSRIRGQATLNKVGMFSGKLGFLKFEWHTESR